MAMIRTEAPQTHVCDETMGAATRKQIDCLKG